VHHTFLPRKRSRVAGFMRGLIGLAGFLAVGAAISSVVVANARPALRLNACFSHVGGLEAGDEVTLNGVRVGRVSGLVLDRDQRPCASLDFSVPLELDTDTSAAIFTKNVLGQKYIAIDPGGADTLLESGDEIHFTQSALPIERIMIRLLERQIGSSFE